MMRCWAGLYLKCFFGMSHLVTYRQIMLNNHIKNPKKKGFFLSFLTRFAKAVNQISKTLDKVFRGKNVIKKFKLTLFCKTFI